jgi:hypothetical protein
VRESGLTLHDEAVLHLEGAPLMFACRELEGNELVHLQDPPS